MISHSISSLGAGIIFVLVLSHFIFSSFKRYTFEFVKGIELNFLIQISDLYNSLSRRKVTEVLTYSLNFTSSVLGEGFWDRNFIELVEANNYHHKYLTLCVHNLTFLITTIC